MPTADAVIGSVAGSDSALVLTDSSGNTFRAVAIDGKLDFTKNGSAVAPGGLMPTATKTANYTCTVADSGTWFNTKGAGGTVVFTLPAVATSAGVHYRFTAGAAQILTVTAPTGKLVTYNNAAATSISTGTVHIGHGFELICDGAFWYANALMYVTANATVA